MDEGSDSRFWLKIFNIFKKNGHDLEEHILDAKDDGEIRGEDVSMLLNILSLRDTTAEDIMVPRTDMAAAQESGTIREVADLIVETGHSRIPIYRETRDQIVGIVHAKDLLPPMLSGADQNQPPTAFMREPYFVPETAEISGVLNTFRSEKMHLAIVVDEYGGTAGLVTLEDIIEEIVGEIEDEHDETRPEDVQDLGNGRLRLSGQTELEDLAEGHDIILDSEQVDTIGGYLTELAGRIPLKGEEFTLVDRRFIIEEADAKHVLTVLVEPLTT
ncbi:MAG: hemolysin family protein [Proteobacteria bacterium]|nr:hemolysin family protein [Pseudomonadota bacterium]MBU1610492.1 hemolysin family protein [Pseudomonadota bacterium]